MGRGNQQEFFMTRHWKFDRPHLRMPSLESLHLPSLRRRDDVALERGSIAVASVGALAIGALAVGAIAIGAMAINRLAIKRARIEKLSVGTLEVDRLVVRENVGPGALDVGAT
jgi:hypothetical protein